VSGGRLAVALLRTREPPADDPPRRSVEEDRPRRNDVAGTRAALHLAAQERLDDRRRHADGRARPCEHSRERRRTSRRQRYGRAAKTPLGSGARTVVGLNIPLSSTVG